MGEWRATVTRIATEKSGESHQTEHGLIASPSSWVSERPAVGLSPQPPGGGRRFDCGDKAGFVEATMAYALDHDTVGKPAREMLRRLAKNLD